MLSAYNASTVLTATVQEKLATSEPRSIVGLAHERLPMHHTPRAADADGDDHGYGSRRAIGVFHGSIGLCADEKK